MHSGRAGDDDVLVLPPLPADPLFVDAVDEAVAGPVDDLPDAQPQRKVGADPRDFASLYIRHRASFSLHARRFLHDPRDVEEVLQEAFLRLFLAMPELDNELQALVYCRRTVTNLCIDRYRADQRRPRLIDLDAVDWDPSDETAYDDPVLRAEDAAIVRQALSLLTPMHRAALVKREIEEKPLPQIAAELGVPEESVKHLLHRARRALRRLLVGTSVEPGVDLSNSQLMRLANERLTRATLRSTNVLIVLFVAAVTVVGALRVGVNDQARRVGEDVGAVVNAPTGVQANPAHPVTPRHGRAAAKPAKATRKPRIAPATTTAPAVSLPPAAPTRRETFSSHTPGVGPHTPSATPPVFAVKGAVTAAGPARVRSLSRSIDSTGSISSTTRFLAPTTEGTFVLTQNVVTDASDGSAAVIVQPRITGSAAVTPVVVQSTTTVQRSADGLMTIDVDAATDTPAGSGIPVSGLSAHIVLSGDYIHVLSETVTIATGSGPAVSPAPTPSETPSVSAAGSRSNWACGTGGTDTSGAVVPSLSTSTVIGISPRSVDDPASDCSSSTSGGSFSLLPSAPVGP